MTVDDAIAILNEFCHIGFDDWIDGDGGVVPASEEGGADGDLCILSGFEAIAVAREYERNASRDMPATRKIMAFLADNEKRDFAVDLADRASRDEIRAALAEWNYPNPSTETDA